MLLESKPMQYLKRQTSMALSRKCVLTLGAWQMMEMNLSCDMGIWK
jgi:hypothetical protein